MTTIETTAEIVKRWRAEGRQFTVREAVAEFSRQLCAQALDGERQILDWADEPDTTDYIREVAGQIRDHRQYNGAGHALGCDGHHPIEATGGAK